MYAHIESVGYPSLKVQNVVAKSSVGLLGVPWDEQSSFLRGAAAAPERIRHVMHGGSTNLCSESGVDLENEPRFSMLGDVELGDDPLHAIELQVEQHLRRGVHLLSIGGDHAVTFPIMRAHARHFGALDILHVDAHPDLYDEFDGNRLSHACPFARIMEEGLAQRLVQVGIRTLNTHQREQASRFEVEIHEMRHGVPTAIEFERPVYVSIDLDGFDPSCAPGVSHHEPGGLAVRDVLRLIAAIERPVVGADIVELNPDRDHCDMTAMLAVKLVKELGAKMLAPIA